MKPNVSLDDLVGAGEDKRWDRHTERLRRLRVDDQFELARLLDREIGGLGSFQDAVDKIGHAPRRLEEVRAVGQKPAALGNST